MSGGSARRLPGARGVQDSHRTLAMVLRQVTPAQPNIDMHIALAYKPQST
jgi:hypothetical protein